MLAVHALGSFGETGELVEPDFYRVIPDLEAETGEGCAPNGALEDTIYSIYSLSFSPAVLRGRGLSAVKVVYKAGYGIGEAIS